MEGFGPALLVAVIGGLVVGLVGNVILDVVRGISKRADARIKRILRDLPEDERDRWREELSGVLLEFEGRPLKQLREGREAIRAAERLAEIHRPASHVASSSAPDEGTAAAAEADESPAEEETVVWVPSRLTTQFLVDALAELSYRERRILELRYGLLDGSALSVEVVGGMFGIPPSRVEVIERQAQKKLWMLGEAQKLRDVVREDEASP